MPEQPPRKWTVMIYMVADNDLTDRCFEDVQEMKMAGDHPDVAVIAQWDRRGKKHKTERHVISPKSDTREPQFWTETGKTDDKAPLKAFAKWCVTNYQAENYLLILWGNSRTMDANMAARQWDRLTLREFIAAQRCSHGWRDAGQNVAQQQQQSPEPEPFFVVCPDDESGQSLTSSELREIFQELRGMDEVGKRPFVVGLDACLLSMAEVFYEFRGGLVDFMVGSQSLVPGTSWPYYRVLTALYDNASMGPKELCQNIVGQYKEYYGEYDGFPVHISSCDLRKAGDLAEATKALAEYLTSELGKQKSTVLRDAIATAHLRAQAYGKYQFCDLYDFCYLLGEGCREKKVHELCFNVMRAVGDDAQPNFVMHSEYSGDALSFSYGVSIYFPWSNPSTRYSSLAFAKDTGWDEFLKVYAVQTAKWDREHRKGWEHELAAEYKDIIQVTLLLPGALSNDMKPDEWKDQGDWKDQGEWKDQGDWKDKQPPIVPFPHVAVKVKPEEKEKRDGKKQQAAETPGQILAGSAARANGGREGRPSAGEFKPS